MKCLCGCKQSMPNNYRKGKGSRKFIYGHKRKVMKKILCACGCKISIPNYREDGRPQRFVIGHNVRKYKTIEEASQHPYQHKGRKYLYFIWNKKQILLHRYILEKHLGRKLKSWEHTHHKDENVLNNKIENLEIHTNSEHHKKYHRLKRNKLGQFLKTP